MTVHLSLSGGMDSTVMLALAKTATDDIKTYSFDYGQRHHREIDAALDVADHYDVSHDVITLPPLGPSALTSSLDVPHGHYADPVMQATIVPGRNLLFIANLVAKAKAGDEVWIGVHSGDHAIYPDCRPEFITEIGGAVLSAYDVLLMAPFMTVDKASIAKQGLELDVPFAMTWSCYEGGKVHCGRCGTCVERREAFYLAGVSDLTEYADPTFWEQAVAAIR